MGINFGDAKMRSLKDKIGDEALQEERLAKELEKKAEEEVEEKKKKVKK